MGGVGWDFVVQRNEDGPHPNEADRELLGGIPPCQEVWGRAGRVPLFKGEGMNVFMCMLVCMSLYVCMYACMYAW